MSPVSPGARLSSPGAMFLLATALLLTVCVAQAGQVVTLVGDPWPPYVEGKLGQDAEGGRLVELADRIFERLDGVEVRFPLIPWNRALRAVEDGSHDGIGMLLKTPERERFMAYSESLFSSDNLVWYSEMTSPSGFSWRGIGDFQGHTVGVIRGYSYGDEIDAAIEDGHLVVASVPTVEHLFAMLARGRVDLVLANDSVGYALATQYADARIRPAAKPTGTDVYFMGLSRKSAVAELLPRINEIIRSLRREGVIDEVMKAP